MAEQPNHPRNTKKFSVPGQNWQQETAQDTPRDPWTNARQNPPHEQWNSAPQNPPYEQRNSAPQNPPYEQRNSTPQNPPRDQWGGAPQNPPRDQWGTERQYAAEQPYAPDRMQNIPYADQGGQRPPQKKNMLIIVIAALVSLLLLAAGVIVFLTQKDKCAKNEEEPEPVAEEPSYTNDEQPKQDNGSSAQQEQTAPVQQQEQTAPAQQTEPIEAPVPEPDFPLKKNGKSVGSANELSLYDVVTFGVYPQGSMGGEAPIEWYVIEKDGNKVRLLAVSVLDRYEFHKLNAAHEFTDSDLYRWLNGEFKNTAFAAEEKTVLASSVSLLNRNELKRLLQKQYWVADATDYAVAQGYDTKNGIWWLGEFSRTHYYEDGTYACCAYCVNNKGEIVEYEVDFNGKGVRPMIIIQF